MDLKSKIEVFETKWDKFVENHSITGDISQPLFDELQDLGMEIFKEVQGKIIPRPTEGLSKGEKLLALCKVFAIIKYEGGDYRYQAVLDIARDTAGSEGWGYPDDVKLFDQLFSLRNFNPDEFMARWFEIEGIYVEDATRLNEIVRRHFDEAVNCYIYGNFIAGLGMLRAVLEMALEDKYDISFSPNYTLGNFIHDEWENHLEDENKESKESLLSKGKDILKAAKETLHPSDILWIEFYRHYTQLQNNLKNLKEILEYLYK